MTITDQISHFEKPIQIKSNQIKQQIIRKENFI